jgi:hypothetical protein
MNLPLPGILLLTLLYLGYRFFRGWRDGLARQLASLVALLLGLAAGWMGGHFLLGFVKGYWAAPDFLLKPLCALALGLTVYFLLSIMLRAFFPQTDDLPTVGGRVFAGLGGATVSLATGVILVWGVFQFLRLYSAVEGAEPMW